MKLLFSLFSLLSIFTITVSQNGPYVTQMAHCDNHVTAFMNTYSIPSATMAIAKDGKLVYMRSFGNADLAGTEPTQPYHMFRIASVSKPITGITIMKMVQENKLSLSDKVFGPQGLLANHSFLANANVTDNRIFDITVQQLLEHTGGWDRDAACTPSPTAPYPWFANHCDPIGFPLHVTQTLGTANPVNEESLIRFLMEKGLNFAPGTAYKYSNIGYLTLGLVIEEVSGMSYEEYVKLTVLAPLGICDMHIGKNLLVDKREREGEYKGNGYMASSVYGTGVNVPWEYGGYNLEAMDAHGGWIATARDLVRLLVAVDGFSTKPDILNAASIQTMVTGSASNGNYAKGWSVNQFNNWWHTGALDGTASLFARTSGGYTWGLILNKRIIDGTASNFWSALDNLPWDCVGQTGSFPSHDLLDVPSLNASDLRFNGQGNTALKVKWQKGNGPLRILIAKEGAPVDAYPLDGEDYAPATSFGMGDELGTGNFVVYAGPGDSTTIADLDPNKTYHFRLFEFNKSFNTGFHSLYQVCDYAAGSATTSTNTSIANLPEQGIHIFPNPAEGRLSISFPESELIDQIKLVNLQGKVVQQMAVSGSEIELNVEALPAQLYILEFFHEGHRKGVAKVVKR